MGRSKDIASDGHREEYVMQRRHHIALQIPNTFAIAKKNKTSIIAIIRISLSAFQRYVRQGISGRS